MKMKKIIIAFGVSLLSFAACTQFKYDSDKTFASVGDPSITVSDVKDSSFRATIASPSDASYYSYVVVKGSLNADPQTLLSRGYTSESVTVVVSDEDGVKSDVPLDDCVKSSDAASSSVYAYGLETNTVYTIYAVATNSQGIISEVISKSVTTSDSTSPVLTKTSGADINDGYLTFTFDDPIELSDAFKNKVVKMNAHYLGVNAYDKSGALQEIFSEEVPVDSVSVKGSTVTVNIPSRIPGAYVFLTYDANIIANALGKGNAEYSTVSAGYSSEGKIVTKGICGRFDTEAWDFYLPMVNAETRMPSDTLLYFSDWGKLAMEFCADTLVTPTLNSIGEANGGVTVKYTQSSGRAVSYLTENYAVDNNKDLYIGLDEAPEYGAYVSIAIDKDAFEDVWGNPNASYANYFEGNEDEDPMYGNYFFSYGYTLDDILGTYTIKATSYFAGGDETGEMVIVKSDDSEKGNVMFTKIFNRVVDADLSVYATFDVDGGTLTIPDNQAFQKFPDITGTLYFACNDADFVVLKVPSAGVISNPSVWIGYYCVVTDSSFKEDYQGWWNIFTALTATRTSKSLSAVQSSSASVLSKSHVVFAK